MENKVLEATLSWVGVTAVLFLITAIGYVIFGIEKNVSTEVETPQVKSTETKHLAVINGKGINVYIIDSCEYIGLIENFSYDILTHKGNCKYCLQRNQTKAAQ